LTVGAGRQLGGRGGTRNGRSSGTACERKQGGRKATSRGRSLTLPHSGSSRREPPAISDAPPEKKKNRVDDGWRHAGPSPAGPGSRAVADGMDGRGFPRCTMATFCCRDTGARKAGAVRSFTGLLRAGCDRAGRWAGMLGVSLAERWPGGGFLPFSAGGRCRVPGEAMRGRRGGGGARPRGHGRRSVLASMPGGFYPPGRVGAISATGAVGPTGMSCRPAASLVSGCGCWWVEGDMRSCRGGSMRGLRSGGRRCPWTAVPERGAAAREAAPRRWPMT